MQDDDQQRLFDQWLKSHRGLFFKVVRAYAFTPHDQEDLFQEIALQLWHSIDAFRGDSAVATWIYRVALNTALAWNRKERKHGAGRQDFEASTALLITPDSHDPRLEWIYQRIAELDEVNRSLALLMLDGFSYRDISRILGLGESNVGVKINRMKAALAAQLVKEEHDGL